METRVAVQSGRPNDWLPRHRLLFGVVTSLLAVAHLGPGLLRRARERQYKEQERRLDAYIQDCVTRNRRLANDNPPESLKKSPQT